MPDPRSPVTSADDAQRRDGRPVVERHTARVVPVRPDGRALLLHGWEPNRPDEPFWFTVGGEIDPGEEPVHAAARELAEETGIVADPASFTGPIADLTIEFVWGPRHVVQHQLFYACAADGREVSFAGLDAGERETIDGHGWLTADELAASGRAADPSLVGVVGLAARAVVG